MLTIRLTGGQQAIYAVSEVQRIGFDGDTLVVVKDTREAGRHTASWDGRDDAGEKVGSGTYFYQLIAPGVEESRRMILLP
jgi:flagellar hook assembly protein FlgD